jgi:hypothetical protein
MNPIILSVLGPHANESVNQIFARKLKEISDGGISFWLTKSYTVKPDLFKNLTQKALTCLFLSPSRKNGARPTIVEQEAKLYSKDKINWIPVPNHIHATGNIKGSYALTLSKIKLVKDHFINLNDYSLFSGEPVQFMLGKSTILCNKTRVGGSPRIREVVAVAHLVFPYCVYLS